MRRIRVKTEDGDRFIDLMALPEDEYDCPDVVGEQVDVVVPSSYLTGLIEEKSE